MAQNKLEKKSKYTHVGRIEDTTFDRIYKYYFHEHSCKLSEKQDEIRQRWAKAWDMMANFKSRKTVETFLINNYGISDVTARQDIKNAEMLFQDPLEGSRQIHRTKVNLWLEKLMEKLFLAEDYERIDSLIGKYIKNNGTEGDNSIVEQLMKKRLPIAIVFTSDDAALDREANETVREFEDVLEIDHLIIDEQQ